MPHADLGGVRLWYESSGQGETVLLLHGLGSSALEWEPQVEALARHRRVIAFDARGHGRSDKPPGPYSIALFRQDAARLLEALAAAPAHVVGFSLGGMVAFDLAVHRPELVRSLVIVNSGPEFLLRGAAARLWLWLRLLRVRLRGMRSMGAAIARETLPRPEQAALRERVAELWSHNDPRAYCASLRALPGWSVAEALPRIAVPTHVITADADYTSVAYKRAWAERMPTARVEVIPDTRHLLPAENPAALRAALGRCLGPEA